MVIWECTLRGKIASLELIGNQISNFLLSDTCFIESEQQGEH